jgi:hypothetical protein
MSTIKMVNQSHACGAGCGCGKINEIETTASLSVRVKAVGEQVKRLGARPAKPTSSTLAEEVEAELSQHRGVTAIVNEKTGAVATFAVPKPYFSLTPEERAALEKEREKLITTLPTLRLRDRLLAEKRIHAIEADLGRDRSGRESERRHAERVDERKRQRYGGE